MNSGVTVVGRAADRPLPSQRAVLVVDADRSSDRSSVQQSELNLAIERALEASFARAGLAEAWAGRRFPAHTGDGHIVGLLPETLPALIDRLLPALQDELRERTLRRPADEPRLRLRASIHAGPMPDSGAANDGVSRTMTEAHRLVDCDALKQELRESDETVTFLAAIVSSRVFEDVVEGGYTTLRASELREVVAKAKNFEARAYLYVPKPSRRRGAAAASAARDTGDPAERRDEPAGGITFNGTVNNRGHIAGRDQNFNLGSGR